MSIDPNEASAPGEIPSACSCCLYELSPPVVDRRTTLSNGATITRAKEKAFESDLECLQNIPVFSLLSCARIGTVDLAQCPPVKNP